MKHAWIDEGWLYLTVVLNWLNREIVGWSLKPGITATIVCNALTMAWFVKKPPVDSDVLAELDQLSIRGQACGIMSPRWKTKNKEPPTINSSGKSFDKPAGFFRIVPTWFRFSRWFA